MVLGQARYKNHKISKKFKMLVAETSDGRVISKLIIDGDRNKMISGVGWKNILQDYNSLRTEQNGLYIVQFLVNPSFEWVCQGSVQSIEGVWPGGSFTVRKLE